jgi:hypothetical protein
MSAWQSAQALLPTKCAPGISSGATTVVEVVEHEIRKIITQAESPDAIATANVRFDFNIQKNRWGKAAALPIYLKIKAERQLRPTIENYFIFAP